MTLWKVHKFYGKEDKEYYEVLPYALFGYIEWGWKMHRWKMFKNVFLTERGAEKRAMKLNKQCGGNDG